jgi:phage-related protein
MGNEIVIPIVGDESKLVNSFNKVGVAADGLKGNLKSVDATASTTGKSFDAMAERSDTAETRFTGFYDTIGGTKDALAAFSDESLSTSDRLVALGQAGADLAGGLTGFLIPAVKSVWTAFAQSAAAQWIMTAAQAAWNTVTAAGTVIMNLLNAAMKANPILFIVGLVFTLVAAFATLWQNSAGFRDFFIGMWNGIKTAVGAVIDWIKNAWNNIPAFFKGVVDAIGRVFSGIGNAISGAFKGAVNFVINGVNAIISGINLLIRGLNAVNPFDDIPSIPKIPKLHTGGVVPGMLGSEQLTMLQAGERVIPRGQAGNEGGATVTFGGDVDSAFASAFMKLVRSGDIQIA